MDVGVTEWGVTCGEPPRRCRPGIYCRDPTIRGFAASGDMAPGHNDRDDSDLLTVSEPVNELTLIAINDSHWP